MQNIKENGGVNELEDYADALLESSGSVVDPIVNLSFLQGIGNIFTAWSSSEKAQDKIMGALSTAVFDYANQLVPTIFGKANKVIDPTVRDTSTTATGVKGQAIRTGKQILNKIWSRKLPAKSDKWGKTMTRNDSALVKGSTKILGDNELGRGVGRLLDQISPTQITMTKDLDKSERELLKIEQTTGEKVLPTQKSVDKKYKINGTDYKLTDEEYNKSKVTFGRESKEMFDALTSASGYDKLASTKEGKEYLAEVASKIYLYSKHKIKEEYSKEHGLTYEPTNNQGKDMYNTITAIEKAGGKAKDYFDYMINTKDKDTVGKIDYLQKMGVSQKVKDAIYQNDTATYSYVSNGDDDNYNTIQTINRGKVNSSYLEYKKLSKEKYFSDTDSETGEGYRGRKRERVEKFLKGSDLTNLERSYIYVQEGYAKYLTDTERENLIKALENNKSKIDETTYSSMMKKLKQK